MKFLCFLALVYVVQADYVEESLSPLRSNNTLDEVSDLYIATKQLWKNIRKYKEKVLSEVRIIYDEFEANLLNKTELTEVTVPNGTNKTTAELCLQTVEPKSAVHKRSIEKYKVCLSKAEIQYSQVPLSDYEYLFRSMTEMLEKHLDEFIGECNYWTQHTTLVLSLKDCFNIKRPGISAILFGLGKMSIKLENLILDSGERLKFESEVCATKEKLKLKEEFLKIDQKLSSCYENN